MGPALLFDKSAIQGLGHRALAEVNRYFYTVVPHVLLMETLGDLSLKPNDLEAAKSKVRAIAEKVFPSNAIANADGRSLCIHSLLGDHIPMNRRPVVTGARSVTAADGTKGVFIDVQGEHEAVQRWRSGRFNEDDLRFADEWRRAARGTDFESLKNALPKSPFRLEKPEQIRWFVDLMLDQTDFQKPLLHWFLNHLGCDAQVCENVSTRWKFAIERSLKSFAPYACHCLRVQLIYFLGLIQGVFTPRRSNIVDIQYLWYTPFAFVFCSNDALHQQMAPLVLCEDQTFVEGRHLQKALQELAEARKSDPEVLPTQGSLVEELWIKHWKVPPRQGPPRPISAERAEQLMAEMKPIIEALEKEERQSGPRFPI